MCGIAGFFSPDKIFRSEQLKIMTDVLAHRGPNAEGYFFDAIIGLGHRRLSIIDLSNRANQPMVSHNGRYLIVYNGEVYNFQEIATALKGTVPTEPAINFNTSSDTEVILELFVQRGVDFVNQLNGMFAIAIYDKVGEVLHLFRDRIGIKPLYYYWDGENFAFASELKSLAILEQIPKEINRTAIRDFLQFGFIPAPLSIYKSIFKMECASYIRVSKEKMEQKKYWTINSKLTNNIIKNKEQVLIKLSDLLMSSVKYQLKSDVPFGVFLSGGIDSSLVAANAAQLSGVKMNTFSIGFEESAYNESEYAKGIAKYLGTQHHEFVVSYHDAIDLVDKMLDVYNEPFADTSSLPTMLVSKLAKQFVTVALAGDGGDELFLGYGRYQWAKRLNNSFLQTFRNPIANILTKLPSRYKRVSYLFHNVSPQRIRSHIFSQDQYFFSDSELQTLLQPDYQLPSSIDESLLFKNNMKIEESSLSGLSENSSDRMLTSMEIQAIFDMNYYLQDDLLTKVDRASMQFSLETRVPYLDHRIVEFALNISPSLKLKNGISKYILKEVLYQYIPSKYFDRPKRGFAIPLNKWLSNELGWLITDYLSRGVIEKYDAVKYSEVDRLIKAFRSGSHYLYKRLWLLIVLHRWLMKNEA